MLMESLDEQLRGVRRLQANIGLVKRQLLLLAPAADAGNANLQGCCRDPGCWPFYSDGCFRGRGRADSVQGRPGVCGVSCTGSALDRYWRTGALEDLGGADTRPSLEARGLGGLLATKTTKQPD